MGDINNYKVDDPKKRAMLIACDYMGSYQTSCNKDIRIARKDFFENIIQIAKAKKHNTVLFSFFSTEPIEQNQINEVTRVLKTEELKKMMKESNVEILLGGQYRKRCSDNTCKYEDIIEELKDLSYQYNVTDMIALDDIASQTGKMFFINRHIFNNFPDINIEYISVTSSFPHYDEYKEKSKKFNIYGEFTDEEYKNLDEEKIKSLKGLGKFGYMSDGLSKILERVNSKQEDINKELDKQ